MKTVSDKNSAMLPYFFILLTGFVLIFFTKNIVFDLQANLDYQSQLTEEKVSNEVELSRLNALIAKLKEEDSEESQKILQYRVDFHEEDILSFFYGYAKEKNANTRTMVFDSLSVSEPSENDLGFRESEIMLNATFINETALMSFLNFLMSDEAEYKFFINSFSYSAENASSPVTISLPLSLYIK